MVSTLTADVLPHEDVDGAYLAANLRHRVRLREAVDRVLTMGCDTLVEVAAHPVLSTALSQSADSVPHAVEVLPTLHRGPDERRGLERLFERLAEPLDGRAP
jgi:acyl transferase domain-containing protein